MVNIPLRLNFFILNPSPTIKSQQEMSSNACCNLLKDVKPYKIGWRVSVKMLHSWKQNFGGETLECILADETITKTEHTLIRSFSCSKGGKIHASCKRSQMFWVQRGLPIGEWRFVENFTVSQAGGQYRPTNLGGTVISKSDLQNNNNFLDLASYEDTIEGKLNPYFLIDVLGEIFDMRTIQTVQVKNEDPKRVVFRLRDTNGNDMECCLWEKSAELIESHLQENEGQLIICLIRFAKISYYKVRNMQITNAFDASLVTLNPEVQEAVDFKEMMLQAELPLAILENKPDYKVVKQQAEDWDDVQVCSISEILVAVEAQKCKIVCSIESINTDWGWFFFGHDANGCNRRVTRIGRNDPRRIAKNEKPLGRCENCRANVTNVSPKYKLHVYVADDSDTCKLMLFDSVGKTVIGKEAVELWNDSYDEASIFY
ncbi:hypothetical protein HID58_079385 [Brassica napus]|uniref:DUF223 domain-containing protein n=1 Tax=Brassica napus TaxID=3708 RepID=A0ABQ7Y1W5_BRANA|nr:hypothetical protein HID58_079385 [Brassica napus]